MGVLCNKRFYLNANKAVSINFRKRYYRLLTLIFAFAALPCKEDEWIRINQLGYLPQSIKVAVFMSETKTDVQEYALVDAFTGKTVRTFTSPKATGQSGSMSSTYRLDFSNFQEPGTYYLKAGKASTSAYSCTSVFVSLKIGRAHV